MIDSLSVASVSDRTRKMKKGDATGVPLMFINRLSVLEVRLHQLFKSMQELFPVVKVTQSLDLFAVLLEQQ